MLLSKRKIVYAISRHIIYIKFSFSIGYVLSLYVLLKITYITFCTEYVFDLILSHKKKTILCPYFVVG